MNTWKRYGRLYRVQIAQFFKTIVQSKVDFLLGLFGFFFSEITGILFLLYRKFRFFKQKKETYVRRTYVR